MRCRLILSISEHPIQQGIRKGGGPYFRSRRGEERTRTEWHILGSRMTNRIFKTFKHRFNLRLKALTVGPWTVGPWTVWPWGLTVRGLIVHILEANPWNPGPNCPLSIAVDIDIGELSKNRCFFAIIVGKLSKKRCDKYR